jgi:hypothetical protein
MMAHANETGSGCVWVILFDALQTAADARNRRPSEELDEAHPAQRGGGGRGVV